MCVTLKTHYTPCRSQTTRTTIPDIIHVPGNHDISRKYVNTNKYEHRGIITQNLNERDFNDYFTNSPNTLTQKFDNLKCHS